MIESGYPDYLFIVLDRILAPAGTPPELIGRLTA